MATKADHELAAAAAERKAAQPSYWPTPAELKAVDQVLIEQTRKRLGITEPTIQQSKTPDVLPPAQAPNLSDLVKSSFDHPGSFKSASLREKPVSQPDFSQPVPKALHGDTAEQPSIRPCSIRKPSGSGARLLWLPILRL